MPLLCCLAGLLLLSHTFTSASTSARVEGNCVEEDAALNRLRTQLSPSAALSCLGSPLQQFNAGRYWGRQHAKQASVVVFPATAQDVSYAVQAASQSPHGQQFAFVGGGHGMTNASTTTGFLIDLSFLNKSAVLHDHVLEGKSFGTLVTYEGGAKWGSVIGITNRTGWTAVGARESDVGVGGFSTGGGIGFLAGAYGYAGDRLVATEVVLMDGRIVLATKTNQYSDLFWALNGAGGQVGIVTRFYQKAAPEPKACRFQLSIISEASRTRAYENTVKFFESNDDPFSLVYFVVGFVPANFDKPKENLGVRTLFVTMQCENPLSTPGSPSRQKPFEQVFSDQTLYAGVQFSYTKLYAVPYADSFQVIDTFFPNGFRRGFFGAQTTNITADYLASMSASFTSYIDRLVASGDNPASALWALQYMHPGMNGNLPADDAATAWPHARSAHQTLFSPAWLNAANDGAMYQVNAELNQITYAQQAKFGPPIPNYPNYISPNEPPHRVWGRNIPRLNAIKEKYDPQCRIANGWVFSSRTCVRRRRANVFAE